MALTPKQNRFVEEYMIDLNATQAAIRAGYSAASAKEIGSQNLTKLNIENAIAQERAKQSRRTGITADRVIDELAKLAFVNISDIIDFNTGTIKTGADRNDTAAIQSIRLKFIPSEYGVINECEIRLCNKIDALEKLARHLGLFNDKLHFESSVSVVLVDDLED